MKDRTFCIRTVVFLVFSCLAGLPASAVTFTNSYTDGGTWRTIYAQGFKASVSPVPDPGLAITDTVHLDRFQFFKSGTADSASNIQLAIVNNIFLNLDTFTTSSSQYVGLSTNTIASTASLATGDPITFNFDHLPLTYGANNSDELANNNYAAIFVNNNSGVLTPVLVSALSVDYVGDDIESDYGPPGDYFLAVSNYFESDASGTYFKTFFQTPSGGYGDANFVATYDLPAGIDGDYNGDGKVDGADYATWRLDPNAHGGTPAGYNTWRANFGSPGSGSALSLSSSGVPEPSTILLAALLVLGLWPGRVRAR